LRLGPEQVVGVDVAPRMLRVAAAKIRRRGAGAVIRLRRAPAESLPFPGESFDAVTSAFGVRNFREPSGGLREMHRVLRPGGAVLVLEFSRPRGPLFGPLYRFYFRRVLPLLGGRIAGNRGAYRYLPETAMGFPEGEDFLRLLGEAGFRRTSQERLSRGIATIYLGWKDPAPGNAPGEEPAGGGTSASQLLTII
ncbi:MAG: class I SAM-dependent methyltransferase, partial [Bacteroidota bacterium]